MIPKFRFFDKSYKIWLHPDQVWLDETGAFRGVDGVSRFETVGDDLVVMQSTGLKDKNGIEVFEGDVVRYNVVNQAMCGIYEVRQAKSGAWRMDNAIQGRELWLAKPHSLEVIGNIHQHQHLFEGLGDG